jgi:hypothetical protein
MREVLLGRSRLEGTRAADGQIMNKRLRKEPHRVLHVDDFFQDEGVYQIGEV